MGAQLRAVDHAWGPAALHGLHQLVLRSVGARVLASRQQLFLCMRMAMHGLHQLVLWVWDSEGVGVSVGVGVRMPPPAGPVQAFGRAMAFAS